MRAIGLGPGTNRRVGFGGSIFLPCLTQKPHPQQSVLLASGHAGKRFSMPKSSGLFREARGFSITNNVPAAARPGLEIFPHRKVFYPQLSDKVLTDLRVLHPYIRDTRVQELPFEELVHDLKCEMYPEGGVFWWQRHVLFTLHALVLWDQFYDFDREAPKPLDVEALANRATLRKYLRFPKVQRLKFNRIILELSLNRDEYEVNRLQDICIISAMNEVDASIENESLRIDKQQVSRLAKFVGETCFACKTIGKEKMACARCRKVFYCGKECQKAHWPEHKKDCMKKGKPKKGKPKKSKPLRLDSSKNSYVQLDLD